MNTYTSLSEAVARSASHNEIAIVKVPSPIKALSQPELAGVEDWTETHDTNGNKFIDAWGTTDSGSEFRIYIHAA